MNIENIKWGPKESIFAFSTLIAVEPSEPIAGIPKQAELKGSSAQVYDQGFVYRWGTFEDGRYEHVHFVRITKTGDASMPYQITNEPYDLMDKMDGHCPERPFGLHRFSHYSHSSLFTLLKLCLQVIPVALRSLPMTNILPLA